MQTRMNKLIGAGLLALMTATSAQAEIVTFQFTATIESMFEGTYAYTDPVAFSTRNGTLISVGDTVTGTFSYDTATPYVSTVSPATPEIGGAYSYWEPGSFNKTAIEATFQSGYHYQGNILRTGELLVKDQPAGAGTDLFRVQEWANNPVAERNTIYFKDADGAAFDSFALPGTLDLSAFDFAWYEYRFQGETGNSMSANARILELTVSPVPEPATFGMLAVGLLAVAGRYRSAVSARRK